jgi:hypothetical protein
MMHCDEVILTMPFLLSLQNVSLPSSNFGRRWLDQFTRFFVSSSPFITSWANPTESLLQSKSSDRPGVCQRFPPWKTSVRPHIYIQLSDESWRFQIGNLHFVWCRRRRWTLYLLQRSTCKSYGTLEPGHVWYLQDEEEIVPDKTKKSGKRRKIKKPKTTAAVHISKKKGDHKDRDTCYWYAKTSFDKVKLIDSVVLTTVMGPCSIVPLIELLASPLIAICCISRLMYLNRLVATLMDFMHW